MALAAWRPQPEDLQRVFDEQNPWQRTGEVPATLARTIERPLATVGPQDVEDTIEVLRKQRATFEPADRCVNALSFSLHRPGEGEGTMQTAWRALAELRVFARPATDEDARDALEWIAAREGKTLAQLVEELRGGVQVQQAA